MGQKSVGIDRCGNNRSASLITRDTSFYIDIEISNIRITKNSSMVLFFYKILITFFYEL